MIQVSQVERAYTKRINRKKQAFNILNGVSLRIKPGEVVALLGHNGSGKSTLIKCIVGVIKPTKGNVSINGKNSFKYRKQLVFDYGVIFNQKPSFLIDLSVEDNLKFFKSLYNLSEQKFNEAFTEIDAFLDVKALLKRQYRKLSFGERVKCEITSILLHKPKLIVLDEPTIGLDYKAKEGVYSLLKHFNETYNATIIITTHEVDYLEGFCHKAIILKNGSIEYMGNPAAISKAMKDKMNIKFQYEAITNEGLALTILAKAIEHDLEKKTFIIQVKGNTEKDEIIKAVIDCFTILNFETQRSTLKEVFENVLKEIHQYIQDDRQFDN